MLVDSAIVAAALLLSSSSSCMKLLDPQRQRQPVMVMDAWSVAMSL
jgi:hypothetical protein